jgi:multidrug efflux system membrane fusion protein
VTKVEFQDGSDVAENAHLFTIDSAPFDARLAEARARAASAKAGVTQAEAALSTAGSRVASAKARLDEARATSGAAKAMAQAGREETAAAEAESARAAADERRFSAVEQGAVSQQELARVQAEARAAAARLAAAKQREAAAAAQGSEAVAAERSAEEGVREAESQRVEAEARIASAKASVDEAEAAVQTAQLDVEYCTVRSPIAGRAGRRLVDSGNLVVANETTLVTVRRLDPAHVEFTVTEHDLAAVQRNMAARTLRVEVRLPEGPDAPRAGSLAFLDNAVDPATGTVRLRATVQNADGGLWPGRFARVRLVLDTMKGAVLVPAGAPQTSAAGPFVYVVKEDGTAELRPVRTGQRQGDLVVVTEGVKVGERVVSEGQIGVMPGGKVRVVEPPGAAPAPGATNGRP